MDIYKEQFITMDGMSFISLNCKSCDYISSVWIIEASGGQDMFDLPGLHTVDNLAHCITQVKGDFTITTTVTLKGHTKFDGAGLYFKSNEHRLKFGIEQYEKSYKIVSVAMSPYSDEVNGFSLMDSTIQLHLTRKGQIISCYTQCGDKLEFHRAFYKSNIALDAYVGFYVQAPFSDVGAKAEFKSAGIKLRPIEHVRA